MPDIDDLLSQIPIDELPGQLDGSMLDGGKK